MQIVIWWVSCLKPETKWHCKKRLATFHTMPLLSLHQWPSQKYILHNIFQPRIWHWRSARFPSTGRPYHVHLWKRSAEKEQTHIHIYIYSSCSNPRTRFCWWFEPRDRFSKVLFALGFTTSSQSHQLSSASAVMCDSGELASLHSLPGLGLGESYG